MATTAPVAPAAARHTPYLDVVLREIEYSGSGSAHFWRVFEAAFPRLSDTELERVALACGERGRAVFRAVTTPGTGGGGDAPEQRRAWYCGGADPEAVL